MSQRVFFGSSISFLVLGLLVSSMGPLLPLIGATFGVSQAARGVLLGSVPAGGIVGVGVVMLLGRRVDTRVLMAGFCAALALGMAGFAFAPVWILLLASGFVAGLGYSGVTSVVNGTVAAAYVGRSSPLLNRLNGIYAIGAVLGPLCVGLTPALPGRTVYAAYALVVLAAPVMFASLPAGTPNVPRTPAHRSEPARPSRLALFGLLFAAYVATEATTGGFITTHLLAVGVDARSAGRATALFFIGLACGRFLLGPISQRVGLGPMLLGCVMGTSLVLLVAYVAPMGGFIYLAAGALMGPVFPTSFAWVSQDQASVPHAIAFMLIAGNLGALLVLPGVGAIIGAVGSASAPLPLAGSAAVCAVAIIVLLVTGRARRVPRTAG